MNAVMSTIIADTTRSSMSVKPAAARDRPRGGKPRLEKKRKMREKVDMKEIGNGAPCYQERRKGHLAFHCISIFCRQQEQYAHKGSGPERDKERREPEAYAYKPAKGKLEEAVAPAHPSAARKERYQQKGRC